VLSALLAPAVAHAQQHASEPASVSQTVDGTQLTVAYSRPRARGRTGIFGTTVKWGRTWTPGANHATSLTVSRDVTIEGVAVPKGSYSVWLVIAEGPWKMLLDRDTTRWHTQPPKAGSDALSIAVKRETRPFAEALTWSVPEVRDDGMTLVMQWDTVAVPLHVVVSTSFSRAIAPEAAARVVGRYELRWTKASGVTQQDTTRVPRDTTPVPWRGTFVVRYEGGELRAVMDPPLNSELPGFRDWVLVPAKGGDAYHPGRLLNGELMSLINDYTFKFDIADGHARGFEVRTTSDELQANGTRLPDAR
jgi:hypothetical protein